MSITTREQLHQQIDKLPDNIVEQIAKFTLFITTQQKEFSAKAAGASRPTRREA